MPHKSNKHKNDGHRGTMIDPRYINPSKRFIKKMDKKEAKEAKRSMLTGRPDKIEAGHKYLRIQRIKALNDEQRNVLRSLKTPIKPQKAKGNKLFNRSIQMMKHAVKEGPPRSQIEAAASNKLAHTAQYDIPTPQIENSGNQFLTNAMQKGPGVSPVETAGQTYLQNLLGANPEDQYKDFAAPYMRQFNEETMPGIAERFAGYGAMSGSGFQNASAQAGRGLTENLASLKSNLINQMLDRQMQGANTGLGYAQLPEQRMGQQLQAANIGSNYAQMPNQRLAQQLQAANIGTAYAQLPAQRYNQQFNYAQAAIPNSFIPQQMQDQYNQYAQGLNRQNMMAILGTPTTNNLMIPPQARKGGFMQGAGPGIIGTGIGAGIGGMLGAPYGMAAPGAMAGASIGGGIGGSLSGRGGGPQISMPISFSPTSSAPAAPAPATA